MNSLAGIRHSPWPDGRSRIIIPWICALSPEFNLRLQTITDGRASKMKSVFLGLALAGFALLPCPVVSAQDLPKGTRVNKQSFGKIPGGEEAWLFTCTNRHGMTMQVTDYGARLVTVSCPDRAGTMANVNLGFDSAEKYAAHTAFFGCTTGRFANRIGKARFTLDGREYVLAANNELEHLHGGTKGFDRYLWKSAEVTSPGAAGVRFTLVSPAGDEGYPGELTTIVTFWLTDANEVKIDYAATTREPTVLNLTNHAYWNLHGADSGKDILDHTLQIFADSFLEVGEGMIPTGRKTPVQGTFMDFTQPQAIGSRIAETDRAFAPPGGYDHCYVLRPGKGGDPVPAARVIDPASGRVMEVLTTEPGVQFYSANFLNGAPENGGHKKRTAFCLETQHFPDSPNRPEFPTTVLRPGETYTQTTIYRFSVAR